MTTRRSSPLRPRSAVPPPSRGRPLTSTEIVDDGIPDQDHSGYVPQPLIPSPQQQKVFDWIVDGRGNAFVEAVAGAGKTWTLLEGCALMQPRSEAQAKYFSVAFCAYNAKIAKEIRAKVAKKIEDGVDLSYVRSGTFHSFGLAAWKKVAPDVKYGPEATQEQEDQMLAALVVPEHLKAIVCKLIAFAKNDAVDVEWDSSDLGRWNDLIDHHTLDEEIEDPEELGTAIGFARKGLGWTKSKAYEIMSFDDMLWFPLVFNVKMWQHNWVLVDEAQDTNPARRLLARKMCRPKTDREGNPYRNGETWTRMVWVGDRHQAIYGFTGASNDAVDLIIRDFRCTSLPLTITYRCPKTVVEEARQNVSHIEAHESAPLGSVRSLSAKEFMSTEMAALGEQTAEARKLGVSPGVFILCRKTAPLISCAFKFIRKGIPVHVEGRDIGKGLAALARKYKTRNIDQWRERIQAWADKQEKKLKEKKKNVQAEAIRDRAESLMVLSEGCENVDCVLNKINGMFADATNPDGTENPDVRSTITLATVHRAKGLEAPKVYILGYREFMPLKSARQEWEQEQEINLIYVAQTRAQSQLIYLESLGEERKK